LEAGISCCEEKRTMRTAWNIAARRGVTARLVSIEAVDIIDIVNDH